MTGNTNGSIYKTGEDARAVARKAYEDAIVADLQTRIGAASNPEVLDDMAIVDLVIDREERAIDAMWGSVRVRVITNDESGEE